LRIAGTVAKLVQVQHIELIRVQDIPPRIRQPPVRCQDHLVVLSTGWGILSKSPRVEGERVAEAIRQQRGIVYLARSSERQHLVPPKKPA
jgi:hypothetical protein